MGAQMTGTSARALVDQWFALARATKDTMISAFDIGFDLWERESRRLIGAGAPPASTPSATAADAWLDGWKRLMESYAVAWRSAAWADQARAQTEFTARLLNESLKAWRPLWQGPAERHIAGS